MVVGEETSNQQQAGFATARCSLGADDDYDF
jgi:hypothetical protein